MSSSARAVRYYAYYYATRSTGRREWFVRD